VYGTSAAAVLDAEHWLSSMNRTAWTAFNVIRIEADIVREYEGREGLAVVPVIA
jgi:hypothetical protein